MGSDDEVADKYQNRQVNMISEGNAYSIGSADQEFDQ